MNAADAVGIYLAQAFWPTGLAVFYPHPMDKLTPLGALASTALWVLASALVLWLARRPGSRGYWAVGWFWFLGTLVPVIGLVQVGLQAHADRYMYLPLVGLSLMVAWGGWDLACSLFGDRGPVRVAFAIAALAVLLACGTATRLQVRHWQDQGALFERALAVTEDNFFAHNALADQSLSQGAFDDARRHYLESHRLRPRWIAPELGLADVAAARGNLEVAIERYQRLFVRRPESHRLLDHYATALMRAGRFEELTVRLLRLLSQQPERRRRANAEWPYAT